MLDTIILCNFGSLIISGFKVTGGGGAPKAPVPGRSKQKKARFE